MGHPLQGGVRRPAVAGGCSLARGCRPPSAIVWRSREETPPRTPWSSQGIRPRGSLRGRPWPTCACGVIRRRASCSCSDASRWRTRWRSAASWRQERGSRAPPLPRSFGGRDVEGTRVVGRHKRGHRAWWHGDAAASGQRTSPSAAPDCLQPPLVPRSGFRQQVSASVRLSTSA